MKRAAVAIWFLAAACSSTSEQPRRLAANRPPAPVLGVAGSEASRDVARKVGADRLTDGVELVSADDGISAVRSSRGFFETGSDQLAVLAPKAANGALHVGVRSDRDLFVDVEPLDVTNATGEIAYGSVVFRGATPSADLVYAMQHGRVEELRLERSTRATIGYRWKLRAGGSVSSIRVAEGRVEVRDAQGRLRLRTTDAFATDAHGARREIALSLEGDELRATLDAHDLARPIVVDPVWTTTSSMSAARYAPGAAPLPGGRAIVFGGNDGTYALSTTEIFDSATGTWSSGPSMVSDRYYPESVVLPSGQIMVCGGVGTGGGTSETYDPVANNWTTAGNLVRGRWKHGIAVNPATGAVYIAGQAGGTASAEEWNPSTRTWSEIGPMFAARQWPGMIVLPGNTKLLVVSGGVGVSTETYDLASKTWTRAPDAKSAHQRPFVATLPSGKIAVVAGISYIGEIYDPVAGTWTAMAAMVHHHERGVGALLPDGRLLAIGGYDGVTITEIGDPTALTWGQTTGMNVKRVDHAIAALGAGKFLVAGGGPSPSSAEIFQLMSNGSACANALDCASKLCVDGVCCDTACAGACQACDTTSKGTCTAVTSGAPHGTRSCAPYGVCATGGVCATSCTTSTDCDATHYCSGGTCIARLANGQSCTSADMCTSNSCTDGVCCNAACAGQCQSCNESGYVGSCRTVSGAPRGTRAACTGTGAGTECGPRCDGADATKCNYPTTASTCSKNGCADAIETHASFCDGAGKCNDVFRACGAYACGASSCKSSCTTKTDCAAGFYCASSACVPATDLGKDCGSADACSTGYCVDGVCCGAASCSAGSSCANAGKKGACSKLLGSSCTLDAECGSGHCVDGVCCGVACDGQCEACDVVGKVGTCWPVVGAPHGARPMCGDGGGDACKATSCNGAKDTTKCAELAPATLECRAAKCDGSTFTTSATCDGAGTCRASEEKSCAPYACGDKACRTSCSAPEHCAAGNSCVEGACVPKPQGRCSEDGLSSIRDDGPRDCAPYRCRSDGICATSCATSADCAPGSLCDPSGKCVATSEDESDGGCAMGRSPSGAFWAVAALALMLVRRARVTRSR